MKVVETQLVYILMDSTRNLIVRDNGRSKEIAHVYEESKKKPAIYVSEKLAKNFLYKSSFDITAAAHAYIKKQYNNDYEKMSRAFEVIEARYTLEILGE